MIHLDLIPMHLDLMLIHLYPMLMHSDVMMIRVDVMLIHVDVMLKHFDVTMIRLNIMGKPSTIKPYFKSMIRLGTNLWARGWGITTAPGASQGILPLNPHWR